MSFWARRFCLASDRLCLPRAVSAIAVEGHATAYTVAIAAVITSGVVDPGGRINFLFAETTLLYCGARARARVLPVCGRWALITRREPRIPCSEFTSPGMPFPVCRRTLHRQIDGTVFSGGLAQGPEGLRTYVTSPVPSLSSLTVTTTAAL